MAEKGNGVNIVTKCADEEKPTVFVFKVQNSKHNLAKTFNKKKKIRSYRRNETGDSKLRSLLSWAALPS